MKCLKCNTANDDNANFCYWCGEEFPAHALRELSQHTGTTDSAVRQSHLIDQVASIHSDLVNTNRLLDECTAKQASMISEIQDLLDKYT